VRGSTRKKKGKIPGTKTRVSRLTLGTWSKEDPYTMGGKKGEDLDGFNAGRGMALFLYEMNC